jgi:putative endonuclease
MSKKAKISKFKAKSNSDFTGRLAEILAIIYLSLKFYRILKWRYKTKVGEIDIIAKRGKNLVFIEVKARKTQELARLAITKNSQSRIMNAAQIYTKSKIWAKNCIWRYDAILIARGKLPIHIKNAFGGFGF